jgi:hypothetical protein
MCVSVHTVTQHAKRTGHIVIWCLAGGTIFSILSEKDTIFQETTENKIRVSLQLLPETLLILHRIEPDIVTEAHRY